MNPFSDVRVLVVADDRDLFDAIRSALRSSYRLTACRSPKSALALIDGGKRFDILVAAFHLLEMSGPDLYRRVSDADAVLARNCLLIVSGRLSPDEERFLDLGRGRVMYEPFRADRLREEVSVLAARAVLAMSA